MKKDPFLRRSGMALLLAAGLFVLFYAAAMRVTYVSSDYALHCKWALAMSREAMIASFYDGSERLWHILVRFTFDHITHNLYMSSSAVTALADAAACFLVYRIIEQTVDRRMPRWLLAIICFVPFAAAALAVPGATFYIETGGVSTWHNPTNIMVRPFAAAVFYMTIRIYNRRRSGEHAVIPQKAGRFAFRDGFAAQFRVPVFTRAELVLYPLCLLLSVYAKPSFLQFFAPAIFVFLLIDVIRTKGMLLPFCIKLALAYIPAALIMLMAFRGYFPSGAAAAETAAETAAAVSDSGVMVYFLSPEFESAGVFLAALGGELLRFLRLSAFPLVIFAVAAGKKNLRPISRLALFGLLIAFAESLFFHETGFRAAHGNFQWGKYLAVWLAFTAAAAEYAGLLTEKTRRGRLALYLGTPILAWHLVSGILYVVMLLVTGEYAI